MQCIMPVRLVMIHQPAGSFSEVATREFILEVGELLKLRETLTRVYVQRTGKPVCIRRHGKRCFYVSNRGPSLWNC
ncbi:putative endopeptidase Clp [Helianthus annuus]|uniref:Endopeptidase Clp n=1 Tax=Helianthus annuus TaxID=4232 RepID=A0A9K3P385_HELAN|nr:putative endopeptidase Clp [Helianthus annuus]KAJ0626633.1 putative endopeptidase Clp [Helianthus annuus]KAJ0782978.1 putative endopeptidase Clp [Helianthus annuus]KAJ0947668.1 putative endopeptidase Clp [Helianthus annuus]KAJ0956605.1 putative endopeptidase Clp [Helianthus annuus]